MLILQEHPNQFFQRGAEEALAGAYRSQNPFGSPTGAQDCMATEWDRGYMAAIEQAYIQGLLLEKL